MANEIGLRLICIKTDIPDEFCESDDELKDLYHDRDTVCI